MWSELIQDAHYYLDIGDESGVGLPNTQELQVTTSTITKTITTIIVDENTGEEVEQQEEVEETINILYLKPLVSFLGRDGIKLLQVRCEYIDENQEAVTKESNVIHAVVDKNSGFIYKYDIAVFEQYLNTIRKANYISKDELKTIVNNCNDFSDFKTAIENL